jgi:hypothetical protein
MIWLMAKPATPQSGPSRRAVLSWAGHAAVLMIMASVTRSGFASSPMDQQIRTLGLQLVGRADLRFFGLKVYEAGLWAPAQADEATLLNGPFALELHYSLRFKGGDIARRSVEEIEGLGLMDRSQHDKRLRELTALFPTVESGDRLTGVYQPKAPSPFYLNGKPIGEIRDPEFAQMFFRIWLDAKTSEPRLRQALLAPLSKRAS